MEQVLVVVDPALGVSQGHHAGFADRVALSRPAEIKVKYLTHQALDTHTEQRLQQSGIAVCKLFSQDYYAHYQKYARTSAINRYIITLAKEYLEGFKQLIATQRPHLLLYHTLNWEHANALSLALQTASGANTYLTHRVLLMFNPGIDHRGATVNPRLRLNFRGALQNISTLPQVQLLTSCSEYAAAYASVLEQDAPIAIHPNLFGAGETAPLKRSLHGLSNGRILLYLGDAKTDKGFHRLPQQIRRWQRLCAADAQLVIQYSRTADWDSSPLRHVEQTLAKLANTDPRLELHVGFWPEAMLQQQLRQTSLMLLDYEPSVYADKTSGLLWLAAHYQLPIIAPHNSWLMREAKRFGLAATDWSNGDNVNILQKKLRLAANQTADQQYIGQISQPLWEWIQTSPKANERAADAH